MALRDGTSPLPCMPQPDQEVYDVALLNTSPAVDEIARGVQRFVALPVAARPTPSLCLLFYGPPGTGKSAYAQQLARLVQRPLLRKRSSDVLSMWVGGTEHNLARAFQQAQQTQAILFLDECDSFLQQRASARQSWEVTQVNELLTQIDAFTGGMLIMATNMPDILDPASLRRFVKVRFSPLTLAQRVQAFQRYFAPLLPDGVPDTASLAQALRDLHDLTLGDFRLVRQQQLFTAGPWTVAGLVQQLSAELQHRRQKAAIGFGHA
jgi:SpoVK/Ycf46/Vps4 family AAA+-type ATPase